MAMAHSASPTSQSDLAVAATQNPVQAATPKRICILLAGDSTGQAAQSLRALFSAPEHLLELTAVSTATTLVATLGVVTPEVIILDLALAYPSTRETVRRVHRAAPNIPLVVLADQSRKEDAKQALGDGAIDYILREYMDCSTLTRIFRGALERNTFEGLADLLRDHTTGLYTRDGLLTVGSSAMDTARRNEGSLALFCVLVQNLAPMRQKYGNTAAENVLRELTAALTDCFRRSDILARIGDAQFAALAVDSTASGTSIVRQRLERQLARMLDLSEHRDAFRFSVAGGVWNSVDTAVFPEFLDSVEAGLRVAANGDLAPA
jgi:diguanylate cyclase (GGDEF)-like protein